MSHHQVWWSTKFQKGYKWNDFIYDYWDYMSQLDFEDEFMTTIDVNRFGHDKVFH